MKNALHLLAGFIIGAIMFWSLITYATWRDNSLVPIEELRDDCDVVRTEPYKVVICGSKNHWVIPGNVTR